MLGDHQLPFGRGRRAFPLVPSRHFDTPLPHASLRGALSQVQVFPAGPVDVTVEGSSAGERARRAYDKCPGTRRLSTGQREVARAFSFRENVSTPSKTGLF